MTTVALATLLQVKRTLRITNTDDDGLLTDILTGCSGVIGNYLNRNLWAQDYVAEKYNGVGSVTLMVRNWPINSITSLVIDGITIPPSGDGVNQSGYYFDNNQISLIGYTFTRGNMNVRLSYNAGYTVIPDDVVKGCIDMVIYNYRWLGRVGEKSKALPQGGSVTFEVALMPDQVKANLSNYRRMYPV